MEIHVNTIGASKTTVLTGHKAPILGVALDPKDKYVVSSLKYSSCFYYCHLLVLPPLYSMFVFL